MRFFYFILLIGLALQSKVSAANFRDTLDLGGEWYYRLVGAPVSIPGEGYINLPATLDDAHKSVYNPESDNTSQLRREFSFIGEATYSRDLYIPEDWEDKSINLILERTKPSVVIIDGDTVDTNSRISSLQKYDISEYLSPGFHTLEIVVNNADSIPPIVARSSNAVSESTQTNWNGILGDILLEAKNPFHISNIKIFENEKTDKAIINLDFSKKAPDGLILKGVLDGKEVINKDIKAGSLTMLTSININENELWSALHPNLHELSFSIIDKNGEEIDEYELITGFRKFSVSEDGFTVNGYPVFLRGNVNAAIFPLTGHSPLDLESWSNYFSILKDYGINHVRFHSWTPPEAAFQAADKLGIYLLIELPIWGELDRDLKFHNRFLKEELVGIMEAYSHHPSFVMFSTGNELWGDISLMGEYMKEAKELNPRILSTYGSNIYLGMNGEIGGEDFLLASKSGDGEGKDLRGSVSFADSSAGGYFNSMYPNSSFNLGNATLGINVPIIEHEAGQYQTYPDFSEIEKYTGNLKPDNLTIFKKRAEQAGTLRKNRQFTEASGKWAAKLYKAEMELAQRSPGIGGIELFGLQDYPAQGTALIGLLDPFLDSKGFITPEEFRGSSDDLVILAEFPKFTFQENEMVEIPVLTLNYTENPNEIYGIEWSTGFSKGIIESSSGLGLIPNGSIRLRMPKISEPNKYTLELSDNSGKIKNKYDFWVYPRNTKGVENVTVTNNLKEALSLLAQGGRVILCPDSATVAKASLEPLFIPDFWNYRMYRSICDEMNLTPSPGTLGLFINSNHPALSKFPTDNHTDWQWYSIVANSRPLIIDRLPQDVDPVIEVIDNVERNFRLSLLLECNVGKGKLMILSSDIEKAAEYPEGRWLLQSLKEYMASKECKPKLTLTPTQVTNLVTKPSTARLIKELKNETYSRF